MISLNITSCYIFFYLFQFFNFVSKFLNVTFLYLFIHNFLSFIKFFAIVPIFELININIGMEILIISNCRIKLHQQPLFHCLNCIIWLIIQQIDNQRLKNIFHFLFNVFFVNFFKFCSSFLCLFECLLK